MEHKNCTLDTVMKTDLFVLAKKKEEIIRYKYHPNFI